MLGSDYGGWAVCLGLLNRQSLIYSIGIGRDITFDLALINRANVDVHAFDPTPLSLQWLKTQNLPNGFHVHEWGIADFDGTANFDLPQESGFVSCTISENGQYPCEVYTLNTIKSKLNHGYIDVLKMDIEGAEYNVIKQMMCEPVAIGQLLVEFHYEYGNKPEMQRAVDAINLICSQGFQIFWISDVGKEYAFIHKSLI